MRMKKKWFAIFLSLSLMMPYTVRGMASGESTLLEKIIKQVKQQVSIPEDLTDFNYEITGDIYHLYWNGNQSGQSISIQAESDGDIIYYNNYGESEASTLAKIDYATAEKAARSFLKQTAPKYEKQLVWVEETAPTKDEVYHITYRLEKDGIKVFDEEAYVDVSKQSGKVTAFKGIPYETDRIYKGDKPKINLKTAQESYLDQIGMELIYQTYYDYDSQKTRSFLAYEVNNGMEKGISAITGKVVEHYYNSDDYMPYGMSESATADTMDAGASQSSGLTPSEQQAVGESENLLSAEAIKTKWEVCFPILKEMDMTNQQLYKRSETYVREIFFREAEDVETEKWATLYTNAKTGELLSYTYNADEEQVKNYEPWTEQQGAAFIAKAAPEDSSKVRLKEISTLDEEETDRQYFSYQRLVNDIPVSGEGINFTYDTVCGQVTRYEKNWSTADFKKAGQILDSLEAVKKIGLELVYMQTAENNYELVYNHSQSYELLDPVTGELLNYYGKKKTDEVQGIYSDIKGHSQEAVITKLFNSGIYINEKELKPDEMITQKEILELLVRSKGWGEISEDSIYETAFDLGLIEKDEEKPDKLMTKEEGIMYLIKITPYKKAAYLSGIYDYPYKDKDIDETYKGAISLAYGFGWTERAEYFKPAEGLTKAQFMSYLYQLLDHNDQGEVG